MWLILLLWQSFFWWFPLIMQSWTEVWIAYSKKSSGCINIWHQNWSWLRNSDQNLLLILQVVLLKAKVQKRKSLPRKNIKIHCFVCLLKSRIFGCFVDFLITTLLWFYTVIKVQVHLYKYGSCSNTL